MKASKWFDKRLGRLVQEKQGLAQDGQFFSHSSLFRGIGRPKTTMVFKTSRRLVFKSNPPFSMAIPTEAVERFDFKISLASPRLMSKSRFK